MVQTKTGAAPGGNPWIDYMRVCAANYRAGYTQHHSVEGRPDSKTTEKPTSVKPPVKRRVTGKQPESTNLGVLAKSTPANSKQKPKPKAKSQPMTAKDQKIIEDAVKKAGKARAKKSTTE